MVDANPPPTRSSASGQLILFVCQANVCRSPMMAFLTGLRLEEHGLGGWCVVDSAGAKANDGDRMCAVAAAHVETYPSGGEFADRHRARPVSRGLVDDAGLILVASSRERAAVAGPSPEARPKTFTILEAARLAQAAAGRSSAPSSPGAPLTLAALVATLSEQRGLMTLATASPGPRRPWSRARRPSFDVPDVHQGEARSHAPAVESLEWASSGFVEAVRRLAGVPPGI